MNISICCRSPLINDAPAGSADKCFDISDGDQIGRLRGGQVLAVNGAQRFTAPSLELFEAAGG
jgi:hypothetical protein